MATRDAVAHFLADYTNFLFIFLLMIAPFLCGRAGKPWTFWAVSVVGISLAVAAAEAGKALPIWPGHRTFPSGHETFGLAVGTCLALRDPRWLWAVVPLAILLGWGLVAAHHHDTPDIFGALLTGPPIALLCQAIFRALQQRKKRLMTG